MDPTRTCVTCWIWRTFKIDPPSLDTVPLRIVLVNILYIVPCWSVNGRLGHYLWIEMYPPLMIIRRNIYLYSSKNISFWASEPVRRIQNNFAVDPYTNATFYIKQRCGSGSKVPSYSATLWIRIRIPSTDLDPHRQKFTIQRLI